MSKNVDETLKNTEVAAENPKTDVVPKEAYETLYAQAVALDSRYRKLLDLYNSLLEKYLNQK